MFSKSAREMKTLGIKAQVEWVDNIMPEKSGYVSAADFAKSTGFKEPQRGEVGIAWKIGK